MSKKKRIENLIESQKKDNTDRIQKQIINVNKYNSKAKERDYNLKVYKEQFLEKFLDDIFFLKKYKKVNAQQKREIRRYRKRHNLESIYNKVKMQYSNNNQATDKQQTSIKKEGITF